VMAKTRASRNWRTRSREFNQVPCRGKTAQWISWAFTEGKRPNKTLKRRVYPAAQLTSTAGV